MSIPDIRLTDNHEYYYGTQRLPGVTEILKGCGLIYEGGNSFALEKGSAVARACELLVYGNLNWASLDERIVGYIQSYESYLDAFPPSNPIAETLMRHAIYGYCGKPDLVTDDRILDTKTGAPAKWHKLQLGAYWGMVEPRRKICETVYLQEDGSMPKIKRYSGPEAFRDFLVFLNYFRLKEQY